MLEFLDNKIKGQVFIKILTLHKEHLFVVFYFISCYDTCDVVQI